MTNSEQSTHPLALRERCDRAIELLHRLEAEPPTERTELLHAAQRAVAEIGEEVKRLDIDRAVFSDEQGDLIAVSSALSAIELDRGGPRVGRYVETAAAALRRIAAQ